MKHRLASHRLQSKRQMLHARLRQYKQKITNVEQGTQTSVKLAHDIEETSRELRKTEKIMINIPLLTPQVVLEEVMDVFSKPAEFVRIRKFPLRLNKMGIKISEDSQQPDNMLNLTEVTIGNELPRTITLATFPGKELLARTVFSGF